MTCKNLPKMLLQICVIRFLSAITFVNESKRFNFSKHIYATFFLPLINKYTLKEQSSPVKC